MSPGLDRVALYRRCPIGSSGTASPFTWAGHSGCTSHVVCVHHPLVVESWLLLAFKDLPPGQLTIRTGSNYHGGSAVQGPTSQSMTYFCGALVPTESTPWVCCLWWWLWAPLGGASQGQPWPVSCLRSLSMRYKASCRWLALVLGLEVQRKGAAVNQGQLPLLLGLGSLHKRYRAHWGQMLLVWKVLGKSEAWAKTGLHKEKPLKTASVGPQVGWGRISGNHRGGANSVSQDDGDSYVVPCLLGMWGGDSEKEQWPLKALLSEGSLLPWSSHPDAQWFSTSSYVPGAFPAVAPVLSSEHVNPNKPMHRPFKKNAWDSRSPQPHSGTIPTGFYSQKFHHWNHGLRHLVWSSDPLVLTGDLHSQAIPLNLYLQHVGWDKPVSPLHPSYQSQCVFIISLFVGLLFSWILGGSR